MIKVKTNYPIAFDSGDTLKPWGTMRDNHSNMNFVLEVQKYYNDTYNIDKIKIFEIGVAGGQCVVDFHNNGHFSIGIEGSPYSIEHQRVNWDGALKYCNEILYICDASREYEVLENDNKIIFDFIHSSEVIEHIPESRLDQFFLNIANHMHENSLFVGSISTKQEIIEGVVLHESVFSEEHWKTKILNKYFDVIDYPFAEKLRNDEGSFWIGLKLKK
jgi:2-polyprenyl-3-methyl-5-hydroxy-6-metoxy-1,4-benzoquinol methylase